MYKNVTAHILHYWLDEKDCNCGCCSHTVEEDTVIFYDESDVRDFAKNLLLKGNYEFEYYSGTVQKSELWL